MRIVSSNRYETILFENMTAFSIKKIAVDWRNKSINSSMNSIDPIAKPPSQSPNQQLLTQLTDETKQLLDILANPELQDLQPKLTEINVTNTANQLHRMLLKNVMLTMRIIMMYYRKLSIKSIILSIFAKSI
ncbi:MAG: hypothetical protein HWD59_10070 [Coxiellaceae bacterium]|nr:MAG: hypothetical protein HWD59_10070 [Coxiellaceae bacterium]